MDESRILGITDILSSGACLEYDVPPKLRDGVAAYLERRDAGENDAATPRLSSTVMLLRDKASGASGFQVFMQQRASTMAFVPDAVVFPGGSFDPVDDAHDIPWEGPNVSEWASLMGCDEETARRALVTAAREVFEETGVLLARRADGADFDDPMKSPELRQARICSPSMRFRSGRCSRISGLCSGLICSMRARIGSRRQASGVVTARSSSERACRKARLRTGVPPKR